MRIRLNCAYTNPQGGTAYRGEIVNVSEVEAERLTTCGLAFPIDKPRAAAPVAVTKPVTTPGDLKGPAKLAWLRRKIADRGLVPAGTTIAALESQLRSA